MNVLLTEIQGQQLRELAQSTHRSEQDLAQEAIDRFLVYEQHFIASVREGQEAASRGELQSNEEVKQRIAHLLAS